MIKAKYHNEKELIRAKWEEKEHKEKNHHEEQHNENEHEIVMSSILFTIIFNFSF